MFPRSNQEKEQEEYHWNECYTAIDNAFWTVEDLDPFEKCVLGIMLTYWYKKNGHPCGVNWLADTLKISPCKSRDCLNALVEKGYAVKTEEADYRNQMAACYKPTCFIRVKRTPPLYQTDPPPLPDIGAPSARQSERINIINKTINNIGTYFREEDKEGGHSAPCDPPPISDGERDQGPLNPLILTKEDHSEDINPGKTHEVALKTDSSNEDMSLPKPRPKRAKKVVKSIQASEDVHKLCQLFVDKFKKTAKASTQLGALYEKNKIDVVEAAIADLGLLYFERIFDAMLFQAEKDNREGEALKRYNYYKHIKGSFSLFYFFQINDATGLMQYIVWGDKAGPLLREKEVMQKFF